MTCDFRTLTTLLLLLSSCRMTITASWQPPPTAGRASGEVTLTLVDDKLNWDEANDACATVFGGTLARIDSAVTFQAIQEFADGEWDDYSYGDSWFGLQWRPVATSTSTRSMVWSDNCQPFDSTRFANFKSGDDENDNDEFCYRMKSGFEWEVRECTEDNYFICETSSFPYGGSFDHDRNSGMLVLRRQTGEDCLDTCNQVYGCYRVSTLGNTSCVVDIITDAANDEVESFYKSLVITASVASLSSSERNAIRNRVANLDVRVSDSVCAPPTNATAPAGFISYAEALAPMIVVSVEPCPTTTSVESQSCDVIEPPASTLIQTTTVFDTVTQTPRLSLVPTTVMHTHTITMTTALFSSCAHAHSTVGSSGSCHPLQPSASTLTETATVYTTVVQTPAVSIVPTTVVSIDVVTTTVPQASCTPQVHTEVSTFTLTETSSVSAHALCASHQVPVSNQSREELEQAVSSIVSELKVDARTTSRAQAKLKSAPDSRVSSQAMGAMAMAFIFIVTLVIVSIDATTAYITIKEQVDSSCSCWE